MKKKLIAVKNIRNELLELKDEIEALDDVLCAPNAYTLTDMPKAHSEPKNGLLEGLIKKEKLEEKYDKLLIHYLTQKEHLEKEIDDKLEGKEARVLKKYYLFGQTWSEVADSMEISMSWVFKLHRTALIKLH